MSCITDSGLGVGIGFNVNFQFAHERNTQSASFSDGRPLKNNTMQFFGDLAEFGLKQLLAKESES